MKKLLFIFVTLLFMGCGNTWKNSMELMDSCKKNGLNKITVKSTLMGGYYVDCEKENNKQGEVK